MTEMDIILLLEEIKEALYLDKILIIKQNEKKYKKSDFFKATRVPLMQLALGYETYYERRYNAPKMVENAIRGMGSDVIAEKIVESFNLALQDDSIKTIINNVGEFFDYKNIQESAEELKTNIQSLKK